MNVMNYLAMDLAPVVITPCRLLYRSLISLPLDSIDLGVGLIDLGKGPYDLGIDPVESLNLL